MKLAKKSSVAVLCAAAAAALSTSTAGAYATYAKWSSNQITFYANPSNLDIPVANTEAALVSAMNNWNTQAGTPFRYSYGGKVNDSNFGYDARNVMIFRNTSNGSAIATTYSWYSGTTLTETDMVFWDGAYTFTAGDLGCSGGAYIEDVATHELGHALGLNHSDVADATMYPSYAYCSQEFRSLSPDDIAAVQSLYGVGTPVTNTAPAVAISSPTSTSFTEGTGIQFAGSASDKQDGNLTSKIVWSSNLVGQIGLGGSFNTTLAAGTHLITASVVDSGGMTSSTQMTVSVTVAAAGTQPTLAAKGYKVKNAAKVDLTWGGFSAANIDVFRNGSKVISTSNDGLYTDSPNVKRGGTFSYKACATGTTTCSNEAAVTF